jgi:hypothetical protein
MPDGKPYKGFRMRKLLAATIWAEGAIPADEFKYRNLKRIWLPFFAVLVFVGGLAGARLGIPSVEEFFPDRITDALSHTFAALGVLCLAGIAFPALWRLEAASKSAVIGLLIGYVLALVFLVGDGDPTRGFVSVIAVMACIVPAFRLGILGYEKRERERLERIAAQLLSEQVK